MPQILIVHLELALAANALNVILKLPMVYYATHLLVLVIVTVFQELV